MFRFLQQLHHLKTCHFQTVSYRIGIAISVLRFGKDADHGKQLILAAVLQQFLTLLHRCTLQKLFVIGGGCDNRILENYDQIMGQTLEIIAVLLGILQTVQDRRRIMRAYCREQVHLLIHRRKSEDFVDGSRCDVLPRIGICLIKNRKGVAHSAISKFRNFLSSVWIKLETFFTADIQEMFLDLLCINARKVKALAS